MFLSALSSFEEGIAEVENNYQTVLSCCLEYSTNSQHVSCD